MRVKMSLAHLKQKYDQFIQAGVGEHEFVSFSACPVDRPQADQSKLQVKIKITDRETWTDELPLEFEMNDAKKLYEELGKIFG